MLAATRETSAPPRLAPTPAIALQTEDESLRVELDALNEQLRELRSTDHALRAYLTSWAALVSLSVTGKLIYDWLNPPAGRDVRPPLFTATPLALLGLWLVWDTLRSRAEQRRLEQEESVHLARQQELRERLGLNEAPVPRLDEVAGPVVGLA
jgi:hypothetical protein